jgi:hypothetical protein
MQLMGCGHRRGNKNKKRKQGPPPHSSQANKAGAMQLVVDVDGLRRRRGNKTKEYRGYHPTGK